MKRDAKIFAGLRRREFLRELGVGAGAVALGGAGLPVIGAAGSRPEYRGPNVIIIRYGGGVRRRESIDPEHTYSPFLCHELTKRGTLFKNMEIAQIEGVETSHAQGTLFIITGKYDKYKDIGNKFLGARFEAKVPTLFEYLRKAYAVPAQQTLTINCEDRPDEEFLSFSSHHHYGVDYRSNVLSLYRFKSFLLERQVKEGKLGEKELAERRKALEKWEKVDYRTGGKDRQGAELEKFWERWRGYYGDTGFVNPRGDRLLTELTVRALKELRPRLLMVNYTDCDYVHWGNMSHYTRGVAIMDEGIKQIVAAVDADAEYRGNTIFVVVPDCGRDTNPFASVPCQHHFGGRSAHEVFALLVGPGIPQGVVVDKPVQQISVAATVGHFMKFKTELAEGPVLTEAVA